MRRNTLAYLRSLSNMNGLDYKTIVTELNQQIDGFDKGSTDSLYLKKYVTPNEYISCRVANHFPILVNYLKINPGRMSLRQNGNICALFFGSQEAENLSGSEKNQYVMSDSKRKYTLKVKDKAFNFYESNTYITVPYKIYHFIPDLMTMNDISLLANSIKTWYSLEGNSPFNVPTSLTQNVFFKEKNEKGISSIDCDMRIIKLSANESIFTMTGRDPLTFDIGTVTLVAPDKRQLTLQGFIDVKECDDMSFDIFCAMNNTNSSIKHKKKNNLSENEKRKLYYAIMEKMSKMLKEELDMI